MELGVKKLFVSTYDNVLAIFKRTFIFISETFDKINIFQGSEASVM